MKLYDLLKDTTWQEVNKNLLFYCTKENIPIYKDVYEHFITLTPTNTPFSDIIINIEFIEEEQVYDVFGTREGDDFKYSLSLSLWSEWLDYELDKNILNNFSNAEIIAHCLWEMTFYGFTEKEIISKRNEMLEMSKRIENREFVEEKAVCPFCDGTKVRKEDDNEETCTMCDEYGYIQFVSFN